MLTFYQIPNTLYAEQEQFAKDIEEFKKGNINPIKFKAIRVAHGVYEQRQPDTYMIRIRCTTGGVTPKQLKKVAELGEQYGNGEVHVTTRQELQIHDVLIDEVMPVIKGLNTVNLSSRGGGGNTIRNILTSPNSGINPEEVFDVEPYAIALSSKMINEGDSWNLPRKFKIAFSSNKNDTAFTQATCLGFVADIQDGQKGFKVYCAGGMGAKPLVGNLLYEFIPDTQVYQITKAFKIFFDKHGNRKSKTTSRIKFLWQTLKREKFVELFTNYYHEIKNNDNLQLNIVPLENKLAENINLEKEKPCDLEKFEIWKKRYVIEQKQEGLFSIKLPLRLGDLLSEDAYKFADFLKNFGENVIRCDRAQNFRIRNISNEYLPNLFNLISSLKQTLIHLPAFVGNMINCTGAQTCKLGICLPRGLSDAIREKFTNTSLDLDRLNDFRLHMSGCPNTCGMHHIADLGFFGKVGRKNRDMYPAYNVLAGATIGSGITEYAQKCGEIAAHHVPNFVHDFLESYLLKKEDYDTYREYLEEEGFDVLKNLCEKYTHVPLYEEDSSYYVDFGAKNRLSLDEIGTAECSAGMFDMIGVDRKLIKERTKYLSTITDKKEISAILYIILLASARMLLVTRGLDPRTDQEAFKNFKKHFIIAGLVSEKI